MGSYHQQASNKQKRQNDHMLDTATVAYRCVMQLSEKGFTVLSFHVETRNPIVWIQDCARCTELKGASKVRRCGPKGKEMIMVSKLHGCQVQWLVRGH